MLSLPSTRGRLREKQHPVLQFTVQRSAWAPKRASSVKIKEGFEMHHIQAGCCGPPEPQPGCRQGRKMLHSTARRTGFPAAGQENTPSHCPCRVTGSPCAPPGTISVPTLATKENKEGFLAFCVKLPPASLTRKARYGERRPSSWLLTNVLRQPLVGC